MRKELPLLESKPLRLKDCLFKKGESGEGLIVNLKNGVYYTLNPTAQRIWQMADGQKGVDEIADRLSQAYAIGRLKAARDVEKFILSLKRAGLITFK